MLQYGITFRLNDLLMLSEAYSKLAKTDFNPEKDGPSITKCTLRSMTSRMWIRSAIP